jgi:lysozyme family protein
VRDNFAASLAAVLVHEGGYVNDSRDPGGATNKGVTQAVYDDWRADQKLPTRTVEAINAYELGAIYRNLYWNALRADDLPPGVDYSCFDFAVNSGVNRAARYLQRAAGTVEDGKIGAITLAALERLSPDSVIESICSARLNFLRQLRTFDSFGRGWTRRVEEVSAKAKAMAA